MKEPILEMRNITKKFGKVVANEDVNLVLNPGEIHALLGENGAGKSTLMNVLTGIYKPNSGAIYYKGKKVKAVHSEMIDQHPVRFPSDHAAMLTTFKFKK